MNPAIFTPFRFFGDGLALDLQRHYQIPTVPVINDFPALAQVLETAAINCVLVDVTQGIDSEQLRQLVGEWPAVRWVALGVRHEAKEIVRYARDGFSAYVNWQADLTRMHQVLDDVMAGRMNCTPEAASELMRALFLQANRPMQEEGPSASLTPRECDVLRQISLGLSNKEIARSLNLSLATVKHHVHNVLEKLQVTRRGEAMRKARAAPWIAGVVRLTQGESAERGLVATG
ncbi:MAG: response regulator transcription factor [Burkholderiales bacterium]|nr:response regulator transcription factor [Burkholderiales bacterium]